MTARKTAATPGPKPKFQVVEYNLHYITNAGDELTFNLDLPSGIIMDAVSKSEAQEEQFVAMLEGMGDEATLAKFRKLGMISEGFPIINRFFEEFGKLAGADLGK